MTEIQDILSKLNHARLEKESISVRRAKIEVELIHLESKIKDLVNTIEQLKLRERDHEAYINTLLNRTIPNEINKSPKRRGKVEVSWNYQMLRAHTLEVLSRLNEPQTISHVYEILVSIHKDIYKNLDENQERKLKTDISNALRALCDKDEADRVKDENDQWAYYLLSDAQKQNKLSDDLIDDSDDVRW